RYGGTGTGDDDYTLHGIALHEGVVNDVFQVNMLRAAVGAVGRDDHLAIGVVDSVCNGLGREATENYRVYRADARTGQYRDYQLGNHGKVKAHAVTLSDAIVFQYVTKLFYLFQQLLVGKHAVGLGGVVRFPDNGRLITIAVNMPIQAVFGNVQLSAFKPFNTRLLKIPVQDLVPLAAPVKIFSDTRPKFFRVLNALLVLLLILLKRFDLKAHV